MSWCRFGSKCRNTIPEDPENDGCPDEVCPGSDVYVYKNVDGAVVCCLCPLRGRDDPSDFRVEDSYEPDGETLTEEAERRIATHLLEHDAAGHHVRRSILAWARRVSG